VRKNSVFQEGNFGIKVLFFEREKAAKQTQTFHVLVWVSVRKTVFLKRETLEFKWENVSKQRETFQF